MYVSQWQCNKCVREIHEDVNLAPNASNFALEIKTENYPKYLL